MLSWSFFLVPLKRWIRCSHIMMALYCAWHILMQLLLSGLHFYTFFPRQCPPSAFLPFFFHHIFPIFTLLSLPFSALQAVWYSPCVCRPAGSDPQLLQRERWKDPELLQHRGALPPVCQQCQTGGCWPYSHACITFIHITVMNIKHTVEAECYKRG